MFNGYCLMFNGYWFLVNGYWLLFIGYCFNVLVESEDGACQQERLRHIVQQPRSHVVNLEHLISHQRDTAHDEQHRTGVLRDLEAFLFHSGKG